MEKSETANKSAESEGRRQREFENYALLVGLYKDYFGLFLTGVGVYVAIVTGVATYAFSKDQAFLFSIVFVSSALLAVASFTAIRWSSAFERDLKKLAHEMELSVVPPFGAGIIGWTTLIGAVVVAMFSLYLWWKGFP